MRRLRKGIVSGRWEGLPEVRSGESKNRQTDNNSSRGNNNNAGERLASKSGRRSLGLP